MVEPDISDRDAEIFNLIVADPRAVVPVSHLPSEAEDSLANLEAAGLITAYDWGGSLSVSLTPFAAKAAGLRIGSGLPWHWEPIDAPEARVKVGPPTSHAMGVMITYQLGLGEHVNQSAMAPDAIVEAREDLEALVARRAAKRKGERPTAVERDPDSQPRPNILLEGCRAWTNPEALPGEPCRACLGRKLGRYSYCLLCYRWGLDDIVRRWWAAVEAQSRRLAKPAKKRPKFRPRIKGAKVQAAASASA